MPEQIICWSKRNRSLSPVGYRRIDVTSHAKDVFRSCSPFLCGPVELYGGYMAKNVENAWQYAKLYRQYADEKGDPAPAYFDWAQEGWASRIAVRRPMGYLVPLCTVWDGKKLTEAEARAKVFVPLYVGAVVRTEGFRELRRLYDGGTKLCLLDYDAREYPADWNMAQILNDSEHPLGHSYVLKWLLEGKVGTNI